MRANRQHLQLNLIAILAVALMLGLYGCDGSSTSSGTPPTEDYRVEATLIKDLNADNILTDSSTVAVSFKRNDSVLASGVVLFEDDTLLFNLGAFGFDSMWSFSGAATSMLLPDIYQITVRDSSRFTGAAATTPVGYFQHRLLTLESVSYLTPMARKIQITWTAALNIEGYIVAAVLRDSRIRGYGYSAVRCIAND